MILPDPPLLVITDRKLARRSLPKVIASVVSAGCRWVMLREKDLDSAGLEELASQILPPITGTGCQLSINGNIGVALKISGAGLHLPQGQSAIEARKILGPDRLFGVSAHSREEIAAAEQAGADYATISPVFSPTSKETEGKTLDLRGLQELSANTALPLIALGGITAQNAADCLEAGSAGVAVLGAVMGAEEPGESAASILSSIAGTH